MKQHILTFVLIIATVFADYRMAVSQDKNSGIIIAAVLFGKTADQPLLMVIDLEVTQCAFVS
jgi:hypothetical protein